MSNFDWDAERARMADTLAGEVDTSFAKYCQGADLDALEAFSRARLHQQGLDRLAGAAGYAACQASVEDASSTRQDVVEDADDEVECGTHRCPRCGYRWEPDPLEWHGVGPLSRRSLSDGPQDQAIPCPACGRWIDEDQLEELA